MVNQPDGHIHLRNFVTIAVETARTTGGSLRAGAVSRVRPAGQLYYRLRFRPSRHLTRCLPLVVAPDGRHDDPIQVDAHLYTSGDDV